MTKIGKKPPLTLFMAFDVATENPRTITQVNQYFTTKFAQEIEKENPNFSNGRTYELLAGDRHLGFGAKLLAAFDTESTALSEPLQTPEAAPKIWTTNVTTSWALLYRYVAETAPSVSDPYAVYLAGVNPPAKMDEADRETFIDFYTTSHLPEVVARKNCSRATAYELEQEILQPKEHSPHFLGVYEVLAESSVVTRHVGFGYSRGPTVWQKHKTPWRLWYRLQSR